MKKYNKIDVSKWLKGKTSAKKYFSEHGLYYIDDIKIAVDIAVGDDGMRGKEVIEILKTTPWDKYEKFGDKDV